MPSRDIYSQWVAGEHEQLLTRGDFGFLRWAANHGTFDDQAWQRRFRQLGRLKRAMWRRVGKRPFAWCPMIELRMPAGCTARCVFCNGAKVGVDPNANTKEGLLRAIGYLRLPETIALCAEWGDPCLHPEIIDAINHRIETDWLITKYTFLTNLSAMTAVRKALPYTRGLLVNFTMAQPSHAKEIMGYRQTSAFEQIYENVRTICALRRDNQVTTKIGIVFIVQPSTLPFVADHYALFRDFDGLASCRYKSAYRHENTLNDHPEVARQQARLREMKGRVPYEWVL